MQLPVSLPLSIQNISPFLFQCLGCQSGRSGGQRASVSRQSDQRRVRLRLGGGHAYSEGRPGRSRHNHVEWHHCGQDHEAAAAWRQACHGVDLCDEGRQAREGQWREWQEDRGLLEAVTQAARRHEVLGELADLWQGQYTARHCQGHSWEVYHESGVRARKD